MLTTEPTMQAIEMLIARSMVLLLEVGMEVELEVELQSELEVDLP